MNNNPDILIPFHPGSLDKSKKIVPLYVRPETNNVDYESLIIQSISKLGRPVFMANYNGQIIRHRQIVLNHLFYRYVFALHGRSEMEKYPEFIEHFEQKFSVKFSSAPIFGSFQFLEKTELSQGMDAETLFHYYVPDEDYLMFLGNSVKKVHDCFVLNYDIPAVMSKHSCDSNILVMMIGIDRAMTFRDFNYAIYRKFEDSDISKLIERDKHKNLTWEEQVKRTYHISHNYIEAMFDMTDFMLYEDYTPVHYIDIPFAHFLFEENILMKDDLDSILGYFKKYPITYVTDPNGEKKLINLRNHGSYSEERHTGEMELLQCAELMRSVIKS